MRPHSERHFFKIVVRLVIIFAIHCLILVFPSQISIIELKISNLAHRYFLLLLATIGSIVTILFYYYFHLWVLLIKSTTHPLLNPDSLLSSRSNSAHPTISLFATFMFILRNQVNQFDFLIFRLYYQTAHFRDGAVKVSFFFLN